VDEIAGNNGSVRNEGLMIVSPLPFPKGTLDIPPVQVGCPGVARRGRGRKHRLIRVTNTNGVLVDKDRTDVV